MQPRRRHDPDAIRRAAASGKPDTGEDPGFGLAPGWWWPAVPSVSAVTAVVVFLLDAVVVGVVVGVALLALMAALPHGDWLP